MGKMCGIPVFKDLLKAGKKIFFHDSEKLNIELYIIY